MRLRCLLAAMALLVLDARARAQPPADGWITWMSNRNDARPEVYVARADGSGVTRLTTEGGTVPMFAPDGRWIAFADDVGGVFVMRPDGTEKRRLATGSPCCWLHDNAGFLVIDGNGDGKVHDPETGDATLLFRRGDLPQFAGSSFLPNSVTHDNRYLLAGSDVFTNGFTAANGSFKQGFSAVIIDLLHKDKVYLLGFGCWPFTPPEGDLVYHIRGDNHGDAPTWPDIYRMSLADLSTRKSYAPEVSHPDEDWGHEYNPRVSNDNRWISYMASTGCHEGSSCDYEIFIHRVGADATERTRVTQDPHFDGYPSMYVGPAWKKDAQARLLLTPGRITFDASAGAPPASQVVRVKNAGTDPLGAVTVAPDPAATWLQVSSGEGQLTFSVRTTGLTAGRHEAKVTVTAAAAPGASVLVPVALLADDTFPHAAAAGDAGLVAPPAQAGDGGCGCRIAARRPPTSAASAPLALAVALLGARRLARGRGRRGLR